MSKHKWSKWEKIFIIWPRKIEGKWKCFTWVMRRCKDTGCFNTELGPHIVYQYKLMENWKR